MRNVIAIDTETALIRPAQLAPEMVCLTWQEAGSSAQIADVCDPDDVVKRLTSWLSTSTTLLVGHNVAYDMAVIVEAFPTLRPLVFMAYAENRIADTMVRQRLLDTAMGTYRGRFVRPGLFLTYRYGLEDLTARFTDMRLVKDGWRMSYAEFIGVPLGDWPRRAREVQDAARPRVLALEARIAAAPKDDPSAKALAKERDGLLEMVNGDPNRCAEYPLDDARATLLVYQAQEKHAAYLADQYRQTRSEFALHLSSAWGIRIDEAGLDALERETRADYDEHEDELLQLGFIRDDKTRTRDTKLAKSRMVRVCREQDIPLRRTEGHYEAETTKCRGVDGAALPAGHDDCAEHVSLDADACEASEDHVLKRYAQISTLKKMLTSDVPAMRKGVLYPLHTRYGWAETGRTTSSKPNIQNVSTRQGLRECYVPRPVMVFAAVDYPALEAYAWAQCCFTWLGRSKLAEALNSGTDPHIALAANILGVSYAEASRRYESGDQETADMRQLAKVGNFGFPGGMGAETMLASAKGQLKPEVVERLGLDADFMKELRNGWFRTWPEAQAYFDRIKAFGPPYPERYSATVESLATKRFRGGASYCAACNNGFQGLGSDCAREALWQIAVAQYVTRESPLFNTRTVAFVHDEIIIETPEETGHEAAHALADIMRKSANVYLPDVPIAEGRMAPVLMRRWSKKAKPVFANGRLIPWVA